MFLITIGSALLYYFVDTTVDVAPKAGGTVYHRETWSGRHDAVMNWHAPKDVIKPLVEQKFKNIVRQAYDYSCGSASLTTLLNGYIGMQLTEKTVIDGLLKYGEYDRIISGRRFSLLDMKRYITALGLESGGFKGTIKDLQEVKQPVIVPISYAGFKHFVVLKGIKDGRVFVADPALGNISFSIPRFSEVWDNNTLFMVKKPASDNSPNLLAINDIDLRVIDEQVNMMTLEMPRMYPDLAIQHDADEAATRVKVRDMNSTDANPKMVETSLRLYYKRR